MDNLWTLFAVKRAKVADLPSGIGITRNSNGITDYWRVRLGKKFTGGNIITRNFEALADARRWIFGDAQKLKTITMPAIALRRMAGSALSSYRRRKLLKRRRQYGNVDPRELHFTPQSITRLSA